MTTASLLEKLDPGEMMREDGLKKAVISLQLLLRKADDTDTLAAEIAQASGVRTLVMTTVLHPEPQIRQMACGVLGACIRQSDASFLAACLDGREASRSVPDALVRILQEEDRRAKPQEGYQAEDPDLPVRRTAFVALSHLLLSTDEVTRRTVLEMERVVPIVLLTCSNSDAEIRRGSYTLLASLVTLGDQDKRVVITTAETEAAQTAATLVNGACDTTADVAEAALRLILSLGGSTVLRDELAQADAAAKLQEKASSPSETASAGEGGAAEAQPQAAEGAAPAENTAVPNAALLAEVIALLKA